MPWCFALKKGLANNLYRKGRKNWKETKIGRKFGFDFGREWEWSEPQWESYSEQSLYLWRLQACCSSYHLDAYGVFLINIYSIWLESTQMNCVLNDNQTVSWLLIGEIQLGRFSMQVIEVDDLDRGIWGKKYITSLFLTL